MRQPESTARRIVVGIDGSDSSKIALRWAVRQAELTGTSVEAVIAWHYPVMVAGHSGAPAVGLAATDFEEIAAKALAETIAEAVDPATTVQLSTSVREGNPARVLLAAAAGAELLIIGSRGHGGYTSALLGSVSQHCAHHAPCPVLIIRGHAAR